MHILMRLGVRKKVILLLHNKLCAATENLLCVCSLNTFMCGIIIIKIYGHQYFNIVSVLLLHQRPDTYLTHINTA